MDFEHRTFLHSVGDFFGWVIISLLKLSYWIVAGTLKAIWGFVKAILGNVYGRVVVALGGVTYLCLAGLLFHLIK